MTKVDKFFIYLTFPIWFLIMLVIFIIAVIAQSLGLADYKT